MQGRSGSAVVHDSGPRQRLFQMTAPRQVASRLLKNVCVCVLVLVCAVCTCTELNSPDSGCYVSVMTEDVYVSQRVSGGGGECVCLLRAEFVHVACSMKQRH